MTLYLRQIWKDERLSYTSYNRRLAIDIIAETVLLLLLITVMVVVVVVGIIVVVFCYSVFVFVDTLFSVLRRIGGSGCFCVYVPLNCILFFYSTAVFCGVMKFE